MRGRTLGAGIALAVSMIAVAPPASSQAEDTVARMSLREKVGQLVMFSIGGLHVTDAERTAIKRNHLGGVILFARNYDNRSQLETLTRRIQWAARRGNSQSIGALISVDQEGGVVKRFPDMPPRYSAPRMGEIGSKTLAFDQGRATGRALGAAGVNVNLAPVADLDLPPEHVMRSRAFGPGRYRVARLARAFGKGLQSKTVAATAKHFPGLGGATINTDFGRAYVRRSKWQLRHVDAVPFHFAADAGFKLIMVGHAIYPRDGGERPASLNHFIATERLRHGFDFEGVAISDDLVAVTWWFDGNVAKACKGTVKAGVDIALITKGPAEARACAERIYNGVRRGEISKRRIDQAVQRVLDLKAWLGLFDPTH